MNRTILWAVAVLATPLWGQEVGDRLRIEVENVSKPLIGTLTAVRGEKLIVDRKNGTQVSVEPGRIVGIGKSMGQRTHGKRGFVIGCLSGWAIGALSVATEEEDETALSYMEGTSTLDVIGVALAGPVCGVIGSVIGLQIKTDQWEPLDLVSKGGPQVGLRMRF